MASIPWIITLSLKNGITSKKEITYKLEQLLVVEKHLVTDKNIYLANHYDEVLMIDENIIL